MSTTTKRSVIIHPAASDDADFILSLLPRFVAFKLPQGRRKRDMLAAIRRDVAHGLRESPPRERFFISENRDGTRTGFLRLQLQRDFFSGALACHVSDIAVVPEHDGEGIGRAMLKHAQRWARAKHCTLMTLSVLPANTRARALYERAGYAPDLLRMQKPLRHR